MIKFIDVSKSYDNKEYVIKNFNMTVNDNEFIVVVGSSGCGKTTLVRMLAGLEKITSGSIYINDTLINDVEPSKRGISFMQQNSKLFPHLNIYDNIKLGLEAKKIDKNIIDSKINEIAEMLSIKPLLKRKPSEVSGGEAQRCALARMLVLDNDILIYDEPLSSLDTNLRNDLKNDIKKIHELSKKTTIYITHDKEEALSLADRIILINKGDIIEVGSPNDLYNNPKNVYTAKFISNMNIIDLGDSIIGVKMEDVILNGDKEIVVTNVDFLGNKKRVYAKFMNNDISFFVDINYNLKEKEMIDFTNVYYFNKTGERK